MPKCELVQLSMELLQKVQEAIDNDCCLVKTTKFCCIDKFFCIQLGFAHINVEIRICFWRRLFMFVVGTAFLILMDGAKQAGPIACSNIY